MFIVACECSHFSSICNHLLLVLSWCFYHCFYSRKSVLTKIKSLDVYLMYYYNEQPKYFKNMIRFIVHIQFLVELNVFYLNSHLNSIKK